MRELHTSGGEEAAAWKHEAVGGGAGRRVTCWCDGGGVSSFSPHGGGERWCRLYIQRLVYTISLYRAGGVQ